MGVAAAELLRQQGLKVTAQRLAVMRAVARRPHVTADDVVELVRDDIGTISRRAVYDAVGTLVEAGLLRRIQPAGSAARYEDRVGDNHHHLICRTCGRMVDVDCSVGAAPCLTAHDDAGYAIDEAEVVYWGLCPVCRPDPSDAEHPDTSHTRHPDQHHPDQPHSDPHHPDQHHTDQHHTDQQISDYRRAK